MGLMTTPPKEGDESYPQFAKERDTLMSSLKRRAHMICNMLNTLEGVSCLEPEGAMYAFPRINVCTIVLCNYIYVNMCGCFFSISCLWWLKKGFFYNLSSSL